MSARILLPSTYVDYRSASFLNENVESILNHRRQVQLIREEHGLEAALIEVSNYNGRLSASAISFSSSFDLNALYHVTGKVVHLNSIEDDLDLNNLRKLFTKYIAGREATLPMRMYVSIIEFEGHYYFKYIVPLTTTVMITAKSGFDEVPEFVKDCFLFSPFDSLGLDIAFATGVEYSPIGFSKYDGQMGEDSLSVLSFTISLVSTYNKLLVNSRDQTGRRDWSTVYLNEILWFATQSAQQLVDTLRTKGFDLALVEQHNGTLTITTAPKQIEKFDIFTLVEGDKNADKLSI